MTTEQGNKLIAHFDGWEFCRSLRKRRCWWAKDGQAFTGKQPPEFQNSWDLLKPVIDKINDLGEEDRYNVRAGKVAASHVCINIKTMWERVIQFIQWYNKYNS